MAIIISIIIITVCFVRKRRGKVSLKRTVDPAPPVVVVTSVNVVFEMKQKPEEDNDLYEELDAPKQNESGTLPNMVVVTSVNAAYEMMKQKPEDNDLYEELDAPKQNESDTLPNMEVVTSVNAAYEMMKQKPEEGNDLYEELDAPKQNEPDTLPNMEDMYEVPLPPQAPNDGQEEVDYGHELLYNMH